MLDQAIAPRQGEELDAARISAYVADFCPDLGGPCTIRQFPDGASNLTYLLSFPKRSFILRRPPFGTIAKSAHDMGREYHVMDALKPVYPYVPKMIALCEDSSVIGAPFYLMERLEGIILRGDLPEGMQLSSGQSRALCEELIDKLIELHSIDYQKAGLEKLGKPAGYVQRQVEGWSKRFRAAHTPDVPDFAAVMAWCEAEQPKNYRAAVIHNDYRFDNVVLDPKDPSRIIGVLDWEMATLGDPLMDLGNSLAYWVEANDDPAIRSMRRQPTHLPGMMSRDEVIRYYSRKSGIPIDDFRFYSVFGLFRLAGIVQQIYYRYYHGQTKDARFARFPSFLRLLDQVCQNLIAGRAGAWTDLSSRPTSAVSGQRLQQETP